MSTANAQAMSKGTLDNPIWAALCGNQRHVAIGGKRAKRYPQEIGPFVAVASSAPIGGPELTELVEENEEVYIAGAIPETMPGMEILSHYKVLQMICREPVPGDESPEIVPLESQSVPEMRALAALVYPRFFRARTHELGRYFGIRQDGLLAAMAGERFSAAQYREISGVCTHPDFQRRGYSKRLIARVTNRILNEGNVPFLHVDVDNEKAISLYRTLGFTDANTISMVLVRRAGAGKS